MSFLGDAKATKGDGAEKIAYDDNNFKDLLNSLGMAAYRKDKDKLRRITAVCSSHLLSCDQALQLVKLTKGCNIDVAVICYGSLTDKQNFAKTVISSFQWDEEKKEAAEKIKAKYGESI
eukprot:CAMPEP_0114511556 /NCGR_PEP_ID=MMETSP0109-20121206/14464_1 /TAXON_ID=29199 /ORGANISM="Chlorarachnion reptans, Strain CCCM449" /LENGTH=118 /DNA_ID=CAMNT_0001691099 /DNA_START=75 /DNA_END=431 /DNA_ORIENTATION=-